MFCPKCGNQLPDGAAFCGECGNKIDPAPQPKKAAARPNSSKSAGGSSGAKTASASGSFSTTMIVALVLGIVTIIFACMPWIDINPALQSLSGGAASVSSFFTGTSAYAPALEDSYSVFGFLGLSQDMDAYGNLFGSSSTFQILSFVLLATFVVWLVAVVLVVVGLIKFLMSKGSGKGLLIAGGVVMAITAVVWLAISATVVSQSGLSDGFNFNPVLCLIAGIATIVATAATKKTA